MSALMKDYISALSGGNYTHSNAHTDLLNNSYMDFILKPRPPAIGEEKELDCNKSEKSTKSFITTGKQTSSSNTDSNSACLTPRKSKLSSMKDDQVGNNNNVIAPLGFEPEGCISKQYNFNESNQINLRTSSLDTPTIPALKWALSLNDLLNDGEGVRLFRQFLAKERSSNVLDFWFACQGLKLVPSDDSFMLMSLVRLIYRKYIRKESLGLKNDTKRKIVEHLKSSVINSNIFEKAQEDIIEAMQQETYPQFLKSDLYLEYVRMSQDKSQKSTGNNSGSNESSGSDPTSKSFNNILPTLHENDALNSKQLLKGNLSGKFYNDTHMSAISLVNNLEKDCLGFNAHNSLKKNLSQPYHAPVSSCLDSEIHSLSSDAFTDEYISQNENTFQIERVYRHAPAKRLKRIGNNNVNSNTFHDNNNMKSVKLINEKDLAEKNPAKFAEILIERLKKIQEEEFFLNKLKSAALFTNSNANFLESTPIKASESSQNFQSLSQQKFNHQNHISLLNDDLAAQNILEQHVSRIWNDENAAIDSLFPLKSGMHNHSRYVPQNLEDYHSLKVCPGVDTISLGNYASMNSLNEDILKRNANYYYNPPLYNKYEKTMPSDNYLYSSRDYNIDAWPPSYDMRDSSKNLYNKNVNELSQHLSNRAYNLRQSESSKCQPDMQFKAGSLVDLGKVRGELGQSSRSDTETGWIPQHRQYYNQPYNQNRQPFANLFDNYLSNDLVNVSRMASVPMTTVKTIIGYYFCDEAVPYRTTMPGTNITLGQFKQHISKKGNYRYFFKKVSDEFGSGVVNEEIFNNNDLLPLWEGKIFGKIEKIL